jgi:hypothetical protein
VEGVFEGDVDGFLDGLLKSGDRVNGKVATSTKRSTDSNQRIVVPMLPDKSVDLIVGDGISKHIDAGNFPCVWMPASKHELRNVRRGLEAVAVSSRPATILSQAVHIPEGRREKLEIMSPFTMHV